MSMYYCAEELETLAKAVKAVPNFSRVVYQCAWNYSVYDRARLEANKYIDSHPTNRPTKERERLQVGCSRKFGEFWALLEVIEMMAEPYGTIHAGTIHDEIMELADGHDTIKARRKMREMLRSLEA